MGSSSERFQFCQKINCIFNFPQNTNSIAYFCRIFGLNNKEMTVGIQLASSEDKNGNSRQHSSLDKEYRLLMARIIGKLESFTFSGTYM